MSCEKQDDQDQIKKKLLGQKLSHTLMGFEHGPAKGKGAAVTYNPQAMSLRHGIKITSRH